MSAVITFFHPFRAYGLSHQLYTCFRQVAGLNLCQFDDILTEIVSYFIQAVAFCLTH